MKKKTDFQSFRDLNEADLAAIKKPFKKKIINMADLGKIALSLDKDWEYLLVGPKKDIKGRTKEMIFIAMPSGKYVGTVVSPKSQKKANKK